MGGGSGAPGDTTGAASETTGGLGDTNNGGTAAGTYAQYSDGGANQGRWGWVGLIGLLGLFGLRGNGGRTTNRVETYTEPDVKTRP